MIRKIDNLGRIVIPKEMRKELNIKTDDKVRISLNNGEITLQKVINKREDIEKEIERLKKLLGDDNE